MNKMYAPCKINGELLPWTYNKEQAKNLLSSYESGFIVIYDLDSNKYYPDVIGHLVKQNNIWREAKDKWLKINAIL